MTPREVAEWLINEDGNGATDEEFAETFVYIQRIFNGNKEGIQTSEDIINVNTEELAKWIKSCLDEIIFDSECNKSAWWKGENK